MSSQFFFSLDSSKPQKKTEYGKSTHITSDEVTGFVNLSFSKLELNKGGFHEPIWHPNANKIGYCLKGSGFVTLRTPASLENFSIEAGDVFFIPQGYIHTIQNTGESDSHIIFAFSHIKPQEMLLTKAIHSISDEVFSSTFSTPVDFFLGLKKEKNNEGIKYLPNSKNRQGFISSRYKFNIAKSVKPILTKGGYLQLATKTNLPVLESLAILGFGLNPKGIVEPHWHTNAGELVYIVKGKTLITVLSPNGKIESLEVNGGEGAFAPASHFHNIENVGNENVEVIAFFSHADPDYVGIGEVIGSFSDEILTSIFNVSPGYFDQFKKPNGPLVIVPVK